MRNNQLAIHRPDIFVAVSEWVFNQPPGSLDMKERTVLWAISTYANGKGQCWPSLARVAEQIGCSRKTVQRAVKDLDAKNILDIEPRFADTHLITINANVLERLDRRRLAKYEGTTAATDRMERSAEPEQPVTGTVGPEGVTESPSKTVNAYSFKTTVKTSMDLDGLSVTPLHASGGFREFRNAPNTDLVEAPDMTFEKVLFQPMVDDFLGVMIDRGLKKPEYFEEDRISDNWHYALSKAFATASDTAWPPDDPRWLRVFEEAVDAMVSVGTKVIRPDRPEMQSAIETARIEVLLDARPTPSSVPDTYDELEVWASMPEQVREREARMMPRGMVATG